MDRITKSTPKNIIELYTKIPDYAEVKHLGNSEFINTLERLKEEFRQIRSSLYEDSDVELISKKTTNVLNIRDTKINRGASSSGANANKHWTKPNYLSSRCNSSGTYFYSTENPTSLTHSGVGGNSYLAVKGCQLYRSPLAAAAAAPRNISSGSKSGSPFYLSSSKFSNTINYESKGDSAFHETQDDEIVTITSKSSSSSNSCSDSECSTPLSRWSSNPEISQKEIPGRYKEYHPPANVQNRLLQRKPINQSEPALSKSETNLKPTKVHPVPSHTKELLFDKIMIKNKNRSQRVREHSKQRLLSQVKPFSFSKRNEKNCPSNQRDNRQAHLRICYTNEKELLNNTRPMKSRKQNNSSQNVKTNYNKFDSSHLFKATPAPPRSRALLSAIRLREQQEYRELKKRLRSETLMRTASLPPSMAARDKETKDNQSRLHSILQKLENSAVRKMKSRRRSSSAESTYTDEDRMSDTSITGAQKGHKSLAKYSGGGKSTSGSREGLPYASAKTRGVFESTSNDNNASRLRVQAARQKEENRIKREEEEYLRLMKIENARQNLRDSKLQVWRRACSYSSAQDIAMRRQLRMAASILERRAFQNDMSSMLSRVRSAPLLLEGVRERKYDPCKKHLQEILQATERSSKYNTPRQESGRKKFSAKLNWTSRGDGLDDRCGTEFSETAAMAEGMMTNSENESVKNIELDSDPDEDKEQVDNPEEEEEIVEEIPEEIDGNEDR